MLNARRRRRGAIDFDLPEAEVVLGEDGQIDAIVASERNVAHRLIEEFMLLANETVAAHLVEHGVPSLHRVHEAPDLPEGGGVRGVHHDARLQPGAQRAGAASRCTSSGSSTG